VLLTRYLTLRSMRARPMRVLLSIFGIVLGVAGLLAISITNQAALDSITRLFEDTSGKIDLSITASGNQQGFREQALRTATTVNGIRIAVPLLKAQTLLADKVPPGQLGLSFFGTSAGGLALQGIDPQVEPLAREYTITAGRFLSSQTDAYEIVLVESFADENDLEVGDRIEILTPNGVERLELVGLMAREGPGLNNNGSFGVVPLRPAQQMFNRIGELDQIDLIAADPSREAVAQLRDTTQTRLGSAYSVIYPASQGQRQTQMLANYQIGLNMMSGIALFVGAFLIYNTFAMTVVERTREFGMLRTIGMTRAQITVQMFSEALFLGVSGSLLGIASGILLSRGLGRLMSTLLDTDLAGMSIPLDAVVLSFSLGMIVTLMAAALPALQAGRISPMAALRIRGASQEGWVIREGWKPGLVLLLGAAALLIWNPFGSDPRFTLGSMTVFALFTGATLVIPATVNSWERVSRPFMKFLYGPSGVLGSRNIRRSRVRTTLTVAALMVGVSMIIIVQSMTGSFSADLTNWISAYIGGDIYVSSSIPLRADIARRIESVEGVAAVAPIRYIPVEWRLPDDTLETINLMAVEPSVYARVTRFAFSDSQVDAQAALRTLADGGAVFVSSVLSEKHGLKTGDTVYIKTRQGLLPFKVAAVVIDFYNQGLVMNITWSDLRRYFRVNDASTFLVRVNGGEVPSTVVERIDNLYGDRYRLIMESNESLRARIFSLIDQAFLMFDLLAVIAVVVASLGVINTLTMNVIERTREIGMLRATGMTRGQVIRMVLAEAGLMGLVGGLLGLGYGILLARIFLFGMTAMSGYRLDFIVPSNGIVTGIMVALVVSQIAAFFPALRAARTRILEAIQYE
jgi:putative ABC transport system permease protein